MIVANKGKVVIDGELEETLCEFGFLVMGLLADEVPERLLKRIFEESINTYNENYKPDGTRTLLEALLQNLERKEK